MDQSPPVTDNQTTAFPASAATPGQVESRNAYQVFVESEPRPVWWDDYLALRSEGWDWRKSAYIAWASSAVVLRWPKTQAELATTVLGLRSDRTIQKWREDGRIDERVAKLQVEPLLKHRRDVIDALITSAMSPDPKSHPDRKMFLEITGDYKTKSAFAVTGEDGGPVEVDIETLGAKRWEQIAPLLAQLQEQDAEGEGQDHATDTAP